MSVTRLSHLSGAALLLGTLLIVLFSIIGLAVLGDRHVNFLFASNGLTVLSNTHLETLTGPLWVPVNLVILLGSMLIITGLPGLYACLSKRTGWLGLVGFGLTLIAMLIFGVVDQAFSTFALPFLALHAPQVLLTGQTSPALEGFSLVARLLFSVGAFSLGSTTSRVGGLPGAAGVICIVAAICNLVHLVPFSENMRVIVFLGSVIGALAFFIGLAAFGYVLLLLHGAEQMQFPLATASAPTAERRVCAMSPGMLYRLSGIALLLGILLIVLFVFIGLDAFGDNHLNFLFAGNGLTSLSNTQLETLTGPLWVPVDLMILLGAILVVLGLPGMYAYVARQAGWSGLAGFALLLNAILIFGVAEMAFSTFGLPFLASHAPQVLLAKQTSLALDGFALGASLLYGAGTLLLGIAVMRAGVLPRDRAESVGGAFIVAAVCNLVHLVPFSEAIWAIIILGSVIGPLAFFYGLAMFGYVLVSQSGAGTTSSIRRPLLYGMLTASVIIGYILVVGSISVLVQQTRSTLIISLLAIGLVAIFFQQLRDRLQRAVNRLVYGERDTPYAVLSRLGRHMEATLAPETVLPTIVETISRSLKLPYVAIVLKQGEELTVAAAYGSPVEAPHRFPFIYQAEPLGELVLSPRSPGESLTPADLRLLHDLAPQIGVAVHAVHLTVALQRSRERLVTAREEERRRLRRDLHDGLGPQLATLTLKLETARNRLAHDPLADPLFSDLTARTQAAVADIRRLIYALRPLVLDELGLLAALREHVIQSSDQIHTRLDAPECLPPLSAAAEVAVYRITQEALTNVIRHAHASHCDIRLTFDEASGILVLSIQDDGCGLLPARGQGVGLASMRERAEELSGTWRIEQVPTGGTRILAQVPYTCSETVKAAALDSRAIHQEER